jgi:hypothetical protein
MQALVNYSRMTAAELRAQKVNENIITWVEANRQALQQKAVEQQHFAASLRAANQQGQRQPGVQVGVPQPGGSMQPPAGMIPQVQNLGQQQQQPQQRMAPVPPSQAGHFALRNPQNLQEIQRANEMILTLKRENKCKQSCVLSFSCGRLNKKPSQYPSLALILTSLRSSAWSTIVFSSKCSERLRILIKSFRWCGSC